MRNAKGKRGGMECKKSRNNREAYSLTLPKNFLQIEL